MDTKHCFSDNFAPNWYRCKCGAEVHRSDMEQRKNEECPSRVREAAAKLAADPLGAVALARSIAAQERRLETDKAKLRNLQSTCDHDWSEPKYTPDVREAYSTEDLHGHFVEGQPPRMVHVPREEKPKWTRTCRRCGKVETTTTVAETVTKAPRF